MYFIILYQEIRNQFSHIRIIIGDGNCLYRALFFAHMESMIHNDIALERSVMTDTVSCSFQNNIKLVFVLLISLSDLREKSLKHARSFS